MCKTATEDMVKLTLHTRQGKRLQVTGPYITGNLVYFSGWDKKISASTVCFDTQTQCLYLSSKFNRGVLSAEIEEVSAQKILDYVKTVEEELKAYALRLQSGIEKIHAHKTGHTWLMETETTQANWNVSTRFEKGFLHYLKQFTGMEPQLAMASFTHEGDLWEGSFQEMIQCIAS